MRDALIGTSIVIVCAVILFAVLSDVDTNETPDLAGQNSITKNTVTINLPAVDNEGNGVVASLKVEAIPGEGRILTNINQLFFWIDTQASIRVAEAVAENYTDADLSKVDLIYSIQTDATVIEGGSAGAALTIATIAVLENKTLPDDVMITGTISPDGGIGPIGGVFAKAKASKDAGAEIFLVPAGQGTQVDYQPEQKCQQTGPITYCTTEYKSRKVDISKDIGIQIKEVSNIREALQYFHIV